MAIINKIILIVDDNKFNRLMLRKSLEQYYQTMEAENGLEALKIMEDNYKTLSAVLLDVMMPGIDGYEVLKRARENVLLAQIPIIMVTGNEDEDSRVKALTLGANDFIIKPFNPSIVLHCIRNNVALTEANTYLNAIQRDKLTGLYNREVFFEKANAMIKEHEAGYYIMSSFDIDNFKLINDQFGTLQGDQVLKEVSKLFQQSMNKAEGICGRINADNFAALFPTNVKEKGGITKTISESQI